MRVYWVVVENELVNDIDEGHYCTVIEYSLGMFICQTHCKRRHQEYEVRLVAHDIDQAAMKRVCVPRHRPDFLLQLILEQMVNALHHALAGTVGHFFDGCAFAQTEQVVSMFDKLFVFDDHIDVATLRPLPFFGGKKYTLHEPIYPDHHCMTLHLPARTFRVARPCAWGVRTG